MKKVRYLMVSWNDIQLQARDIPKLRGFFARKFADYPLFHNHTQNQGFNYAAPRIQYRLIDSRPTVLAFGEGIDLLKKVFMEVDELEINGRTLRSNEREVSLRKAGFNAWNRRNSQKEKPAISKYCQKRPKSRYSDP